MLGSVNFKSRKVTFGYVVNEDTGVITIDLVIKPGASEYSEYMETLTKIMVEQYMIPAGTLVEKIGRYR